MNPHSIMSATGLVEHVASQHETLSLPLAAMSTGNAVTSFNALILFAATAVRHAAQLYENEIPEHVRQQLSGESRRCSSALAGAMGHCIRDGCRHRTETVAAVSEMLCELATTYPVEGACTQVEPHRAMSPVGPCHGGG